MRVVMVALGSVAVLWAAVPARGGEVLDEVAADPPATGGMVVRIAPDGPSEL